MSGNFKKNQQSFEKNMHNEETLAEGALGRNKGLKMKHVLNTSSQVQIGNPKPRVCIHSTHLVHAFPKHFLTQ